MVFVITIALEATPQLTAPAIHRMLSKSDRSLKSFVMPTPRVADMTCPRMEFRGWPKDARIALYSRIADAPSLKLARPEKCHEMKAYKTCNQDRRVILLY